MDPFEHEMDKALQKLADDIIPSDEYLKKQNNCADNVSLSIIVVLFSQ